MASLDCYLDNSQHGRVIRLAVHVVQTVVVVVCLNWTWMKRGAVADYLLSDCTLHGKLHAGYLFVMVSNIYIYMCVVYAFRRNST